jgi:mannonate dehydratase
MISYSRRGPNTSGMQLAELFYPGDTAKIRLARQVGITHAFYSVPTVLARVPRSEYVRELKRVQADLESADLIFAGVESHPVPAEKIKLGLPGRDEEIENYFAAIRALAEIGVHLICYNWMAGLSWYRTRVDLPGRGNALLSEFDYRAAERQGVTEWGTVTEETVWSSLEYFLDAVIPIAEANDVKLALHPDDPPVSPLRGIGRILTSADSFRRVLSFRQSPVNGITFCQANFSLMQENIAALADEWCKE